ncbi:uncharacterized protein map3k2 isoform X2 [Hypomesus transpacificus]|nr:uncharacterized protein map3k2 isoform X2 [Hypomesus transpacificus]XP_046886400.1 uncharacterized protein map3k2 isoform X2 [Hypomesus transpacificus]
MGESSVLDSWVNQSAMMMDEKEAALNSIMQDLAELQRSCRPAMSLSDLGKPKTSSPKNQNDVRVKFEFKGEKRILQFPRPVKLDDLEQKAKAAFGQAMDLHYTNNELVIPLTTQDDLDKAVELLDRSNHMKSLKILLVLQASSQSSSSSLDRPSFEDLDNTGFRGAEITKNMLALLGSHSTDRSSPPPGYIPDALQQVARNGSFTSIYSEGEFIPESMDQMLDPLSMSSPENSASGSCPSLDSPLDSDYPKSRMPRAQSYPDNHQDFTECDIPVFEKSGKGGTYPRRYHVPFGFQDYSDGEVAPHVAVTFSRPAPVDSSSSSSPRRPQDLPSRPPDPGPRLPLPGQLQPHGAVPQHQQRQQHLHPRTGGAGSQAQGQRHRAHPHAHPLRHGHQSPQPLSARAHQLAPGQAAGPGGVRPGVPVLRRRHWTRAGRQAGPVRPGEPGDQQGGERSGVRDPAAEEPVSRAHRPVLRLPPRLQREDPVHLHGVHAGGECASFFFFSPEAASTGPPPRPSALLSQFSEVPRHDMNPLRPAGLHQGPAEVVRRPDRKRHAPLHPPDPGGRLLPAQQHDRPPGHQRGQHPEGLGGEREAGGLWGKPAAADHLPVGDRHQVCDRHPLLDEPGGDQRRGLRQEGRHLECGLHHRGDADPAPTLGRVRGHGGHL